MRARNRPKKRRSAGARDSEPPNLRGSRISPFARLWRALRQRAVYRPLTIGAAVLILTLLLVPKRHSVDLELYHVGEIARRDIWATEEITIEDKETTEAKRQTAAEEVVPIYDYDEQAIAQRTKTIRIALAQVREGLAKRKELIAALELSARKSEADSKEALNKADPKQEAKEVKAAEGQSDSQPQIKPTIDDLRKGFLQTVGLDLSAEEVDLLLSEGCTPGFENCVVQSFSEACKDGVVADKDLLIANSENGITVREVGTGINRLLAPSLLYSVPDAKEARARAKRLMESLCPDLRKYHALIEKIASNLIGATLTSNRSETEKSKDEARAAVEPVYYKIKKGQMIIRAREMVTAKHRRVLEAMAKDIRPLKRTYSAIGTPLFLGIVIALIYMLGRRLGVGNAPRYKDEVLFWVIVVLNLIFAKGFLWGIRSLVESIEQAPFNRVESYYFATPLGLGSVLATLLLGKRAGMAAAILSCAIVPLLFGSNPVIMMTALLSGLAVVFVAEKYKSGALMFKAGLSVGVVAAAVTLSMQVLDPDVRFTATGNFNTLCGFGQGLVVIALSGILLPVLQLLFGVWTRGKLLELASSDEPLIKRLMIEAGGTHSHSLRVGELARSACDAVGANGVVALVSSYYHDIGKLKRPGYFIENTPVGGDNPHDNLTPAMSVRILTEHVAYGVDLARKNKLPPVIIDAIEQHHGMSLIRPFYHKALELAKRTGENVSESEFRYPGVKPRTREIGIIMLADSVEAASRVLTNPTRDKIARMVDRIAAWYVEDDQLDNCNLTLKDIRKCKESFVMVLQGMLHSRVEYPTVDGQEDDETAK